jgi:hypothetical protein
VNEPRPALVSRWADFWLIGGASLFTWSALVMAQPFRGRDPNVALHFAHLAAVASTLGLLVNYPHFMASYWLAYSRGTAFLRRHPFQLVVVPLLLLAAFVAGRLLYDDPATGAAFASAAVAALEGAGLRPAFGEPATLGRLLSGLLLNLMYLTVGWHYSKQTYGCMMVYAHYDGFALDPGQRRTLRWALHGLWITFYVYTNLTARPQAAYGVAFLAWGFPRELYVAAAAASVVGLGLAARTIARAARAAGRRPSASFLVAPLAFLTWWFPPLIQADFLVQLVPFFHGLQYLPFVQRIERSGWEARGAADAHLRGGLLAGLLIVTGVLVFELVPGRLDLAATAGRTAYAWYAIAFAAFVNIHHFFIDNALWRFDDERVREHLLGPARPAKG